MKDQRPGLNTGVNTRKKVENMTYGVVYLNKLWAVRKCGRAVSQHMNAVPRSTMNTNGGTEN